MKRFISQFILRGLISWGIGPLILAIVYLILERAVGIDTLTVPEVVVGIFSISALSFVAGGMNAVYQIERLPLMTAILIHGVVLYIGYLGTYLLNDWISSGVIPIIIFTAIFIVGYIVIWAIIYSITKRKTMRLNKILEKKKQQEL